MTLEKWRGTRVAKYLFWAAAAFAFVMAVLPHPPQVPGNPNDKLQHITAFATLSLLASFAYPATPLLILLVRLSLFGAFIEVVQAIPFLHRDSDILDWLADTGAIILVLIAIGWRRHRRL